MRLTFAEIRVNLLLKKLKKIYGGSMTTLSGRGVAT
jgi:hypothetical protein